MDWEKYEIEFPESLRRIDLELGIDEAGRGPVLGPMVYSGAFAAVGYEWPESVDDSKQLTPQKREENLGILKELPVGFVTRVLTAEEICAKSFATKPTNLNEMSHDSARMIIQTALDNGLKITHVYVDTVGSPEKYQAKLKGFFPKIKIRVEKKADSKFKSVGAASINAKVRRDFLLHNFKFEEPGIAFPLDYGSGYTSDSTTVQWLEEIADPVFGFPSFVRFFWKTIPTMLEKKGMGAQFNNEESEEPPEPNLDSGFYSTRNLTPFLLE